VSGKPLPALHDAGPFTGAYPRWLIRIWRQAWDLRGDAIWLGLRFLGLGGRPYPFSGEQVRVREADRDIAGLCAWGDKVHRKIDPNAKKPGA